MNIYLLLLYLVFIIPIIQILMIVYMYRILHEKYESSAIKILIPLFLMQVLSLLMIFIFPIPDGGIFFYIISGDFFGLLMIICQADMIKEVWKKRTHSES